MTDLQMVSFSVCFPRVDGVVNLEPIRASFLGGELIVASYVGVWL